jgi:hypothetical protein
MHICRKSVVGCKQSMNHLPASPAQNDSYRQTGRGGWLLSFWDHDEFASHQHKTERRKSRIIFAREVSGNSANSPDIVVFFDGD